jgi:anti-sigma regulatory factor (Ser/Thr protein kinase)
MQTGAGRPEPVYVELSGRRSDVRVVRLLTEDYALRCGADADQAALASLLVSELATNAVQHARSGFTVALELRGGSIAARVCDLHRAVDRVRAAPPRGSAGRGLFFVDRMADAWGVEPTETGKAVWFTIRLHR